MTSDSPLLLHIFPTLGAGGREMRAVQLMGMMPEGTRHRVVSLNGELEVLAQLPEGVDCEVVEAPQGGGPIARQRQARRWLRESGADLVLTYNWGSIEWLLAAGRAGLPVVHHEDGFGPDEVDGQVRRRVWIRRFVLRSADAVVVPSRTLLELATRTWKLPPDKLLYLPNGVDLERFAPGEARDGEKLCFVCVGRLRPEKNQALAIEAFDRAGCRDRARLRLVGDGPDEAALRAMVEERGLADRVILVGPVDDTAPEYRGADVFLIPSKTEQMPLGLLEAMATGLPAVACDVGDVRSMVAEENRPWVVPPQDADALAAAMDRAAEDVEARRLIGAANRRRVEAEFGRQDCYGRYVELYLSSLRR